MQGERTPRPRAAPLQGKRVAVRPATLEDADLLVEWHLDPDVSAFWDGHTFTRDQMMQRITNDLVESRYIARERVGRGNRYRVDPQARMRHPAQREHVIGELLELLRPDAESAS